MSARDGFSTKRHLCARFYDRLYYNENSTVYTRSLLDAIIRIYNESLQVLRAISTYLRIPARVSRRANLSYERDSFVLSSIFQRLRRLRDSSHASRLTQTFRNESSKPNMSSSCSSASTRSVILAFVLAFALATYKAYKQLGNVRVSASVSVSISVLDLVLVSLPHLRGKTNRAFQPDSQYRYLQDPLQNNRKVIRCVFSMIRSA